MSGIISFLGGAAFRAIWGEIASYFSKKQEHKFEQQRMLLQGKLDGEQHARNLESLRVQAELGVKTIQVQADADERRVEAQGWADAVAAARTPTGIQWADAWNGIIRPAWATAALALWLYLVFTDFRMMLAFSLDLIALVVGFYYADRSLSKRGK